MSWEIDLIDRRRRLTGESFQTAADEIRAGIAALPVSELRRLRALAGEQVLPAPFGLDGVIPPVVRAALFPDAIARSQIELEAGVLEAATDAVHHLHNRPGSRLTKPAAVIQSVTPLRDRLQLRVDPVAVAPLLYEVMPFEFDGEVSGIKGLRIRQRRRSTELFLVDAPDAVVELVGVDRPSWLAAAAYRAVRNREVPTGVCLGSVAPDRLARAEVRALDSYGRAFGPSEIASGFLRRIAVLRHTLWIRTWTIGCTDLNVEWPGGNPRHAHVALALAHPLFGITGAEIETPTVLQISSTRPACNHGDDLCRAHRLRLRFTELPADDLSSESALVIIQAHARPEWDAWDQARGGHPES